MQFSSIQPIDRALSTATIPGQSNPESNWNEGLLRIPQSTRISGSSPSHSGGSYPSAEVQLMYTTAPADWAIHRVKTGLFQIIQFCISTQFRYQNRSIKSNSV